MTLDEALRVADSIEPLDISELNGPHTHAIRQGMVVAKAALKRLSAEVRRLQAGLQCVGQIEDICVFDYTHQVCDGCRCKRMPLPEGPGSNG